MLIFTDDENDSVIPLVLDGHCERLRSVQNFASGSGTVKRSILNMNADIDDR